MKFLASSLGPSFRQIKMAFPNISNANRLPIAIGRIDLEELTVSQDMAVEFTINLGYILFILSIFARYVTSVFYGFFVEWIIGRFHGYPFRYRYYYTRIVNLYIILTLIEESICEICYFATAQFLTWKSSPVIRSLQFLRFITGLLYTLFVFLNWYSPAAKPRFGALPCFEVLSLFLDGFCFLRHCRWPNRKLDLCKCWAI